MNASNPAYVARFTPVDGSTQVAIEFEGLGVGRHLRRLNEQFASPCQVISGPLVNRGVAELLTQTHQPVSDEYRIPDSNRCYRRERAAS